MTYFLSAFIFPVAALAVLFGLGLLAAAAGGNRVRPELIAPLGLGVVIVLGQYTAWAGIGTPVNVILMVALAITGYLLLARKRGAFWPERDAAKDWPWWLGSGILAGGIVLATIIFFGRATMAGFLLDTTSTVQMFGGDFALHGSDNFNAIHPTDSGEGLTRSYFGYTAYPYGSQIALALLGSLGGTGLLWVYTPFMALMVCLSGFGLFRIARLMELPRAWSSLAALVGAAPAIVYANALQGSIKEVVFIPLLIVLGLLLLDPVLRSSSRSIAVVGGIVGAAAIGAIGFAALAWIAPLGLAALLAQNERFRGEWTIKQTVIAAALAGAALVVALIPKLGGAIDAFKLATALSQTNSGLAADPGNLTAPIHKVQAFGVWLGNSHRLPPDLPQQTYVLIGVVVAAFALGGLALIARRMWTRVAWMGILIVLWYALTWRGTLWLDSKLVVIASHMVMVIAVFGAAQLTFSVKGATWPSGGKWKGYWERVPAYGVASVIALGVLASAGIQYLGTGMLPTDRYKELESLNGRFAGQGPAFMPDFDENALYVIRDIGGNGPGNAYTDGRYTQYRDGTPVGYGHSADLDNIIDRGYRHSPMVIQRRGPQRSRPGADYDFVRSGANYDTFKRNDVRVVDHLPLGNRVVAYGYPRCEEVRKLAARAERDDSLKLVAARANTDTFTVGTKQLKFSGPLAAGGAAGSIAGAGEITFTTTVMPGQNLWWFGTVSRELDVRVDGRSVGTLPYSLGGDGNVSGPVKLPAGEHTIVIHRNGGGPVPGGRLGSALFGLGLGPANVSEISEIDPADAEDTLCGQQSDWIELVRR